MRTKNQIPALPVMLCILLIVFLFYSIRVFNSKDSFNYPPEKKHSHKDPRPTVEQPFLQKYDSLTTAEIDVFISDWAEWSKQRQALATNATANDICSQVLEYYADKAACDSAEYSVLAYCILVRHSSKSFRVKRDSASDSFDCDTTFVIPVSCDERPVLYLTPEIDAKIDQYLHWIYMYRDGEDYEERHLDREQIVGRYCPVQPGGDIPGYYTYYSFPRITQLIFFKNGVIVNVTIDPFRRQSLFLRKNSIEKAIVVSDWIV